MTEKERIDICRSCTNRGMDRDIGIFCLISGVKPIFEQQCSEYDMDEKVALRKLEERQEEKPKSGMSTWAIIIAVIFVIRIIFKIIKYANQ